MTAILAYHDHAIVISSESPDLPRYDPRSVDNTRGREEECYLGDDGYRPSSRHRIAVVHGETVLASRVLLAGGGRSGVHARSAVLRGSTCFVAVGPFVCALELPTLRQLWHTQVDPATCFGLYDAPRYASLVSHGELEITRLDYSGRLLWSSGGRDIFSEEFALHEHHAAATDFEGTRYRFELETGRSRIVGP